MTKRRILALILIVAAFIVVIVVFASVFTVRNVMLVYHDEEGDLIASPSDSLTGNDILGLIGLQNILFLNNTSSLDLINKSYHKYHAIDMVKSFPNTISIHFVERVAVFKISIGSGIFVDSFGYVVEDSQNQVLDISNVFPSGIESSEIGSKIQFNAASDNQRLEAVLQTASSVWRMYYAFNDIPKIIAQISFDDDNGKMTIVTQNGTNIVVYAPQSNLSERLIHAFSVYYNDYINLQHSGATILVPETGDIQTLN